MIQVSICPTSSVHILQPVIISQWHLYVLTQFIKAHMLHYLCFHGWQSRDLDLEIPRTSERGQKLASSIFTTCCSAIFLLNIGNEYYLHVYIFFHTTPLCSWAFSVEFNNTTRPFIWANSAPATWIHVFTIDIGWKIADTTKKRTAPNQNVNCSLGWLSAWFFSQPSSPIIPYNHTNWLL